MTSHREERQKSKKDTATLLDPPKLKFIRKDMSPAKHHHTQLVPIDNMIRRMNAGELIKKSDPSVLQQRILLDGQKFDENMDTSSYLHQLKKGYDQLVKVSVKKQGETTRMKEEIEMIRKRIRNSTESAENQKKYIEEMEKKWQGLRLKQQTTIMASKTLEHMLDRMKKDQIIHQIKVNQLQTQVKDMQSQITQSRSKNMNLHEFEALSNIAVKSVQENYIEARQQRKRDMTHFENIIVKRKEADERQQERQRVTDDIQAMAASDLNDTEMIRWKKLLMVQKFLKRMLKFKIVNLDMKYSEVKSAYYMIKLRTNISDPGSLANSYFNLEDTYQKLLQNVRQLEEKIKQFQQQKKTLQNKYEDVKSEILLLTKDRDSKLPATVLAKQASELTQKSFQSELVEDRIYFWLINNMYKLDSANQKLMGNKNKYFEEYSKEKLAEHLNYFCQQLYESVQGLGQEAGKRPLPYNVLRNLQATITKVIVDDEQEQKEIEKQDLIRRQFPKKMTKKVL